MSFEEKSPISEWYAGQSIFITGGTGYMGKVLVEKILYASPGVDKIYVLMRSKRGRSPEQRLEDMYKLPMFHRIRDNNPSVYKKIIPVHGDVCSDDLGLSADETKLLIDNVSIVFHCAATLKLEAQLKDAIEMNTAGTDRVIELAKKIKKLKAFIHMSTAFCSVDIDVFEEKVYPSPDDPKKVIEVCKWINNDALVKATPALIKPHPNTYTYSKRLAETLAANAEKESNMRVAIVRPAIVTPAGIEPLPGWVDSLNGPMGLLVGAGKGVIRSMHCKGENRAQTVPVDMAISAMLVVAWKLGSAKEKPKEIPVYNLTNDGVLQQTWGDVLTKGREVVYKNPFEMMVWYPDGDMRSSKLVHQIYCLLLHWIPAYFIDLLMFIFRQKRFMVRIQSKVHDGLELLQFFTTREWVFKSDNFLDLWNSGIMNKKDKELYVMDFFLFSIEEYLVRCVLGTRQYCMKEPLSSLPRCRIQQKFMYALHKLLVFALYFGMFYMIYSYSSTVKDMFDFAGGYVKNVPIIGKIVPN